MVALGAEHMPLSEVEELEEMIDHPWTDPDDKAMIRATLAEAYWPDEMLGEVRWFDEDWWRGD